MWPKQEAKSWQNQTQVKHFPGFLFPPFVFKTRQGTPNSKQKSNPWTPDVTHAPHGTPVGCFTTGKPKTERVEKHSAYMQPYNSED